MFNHIYFKWLSHLQSTFIPLQRDAINSTSNHNSSDQVKVTPPYVESVNSAVYRSLHCYFARLIGILGSEWYLWLKPVRGRLRHEEIFTLEMMQFSAFSVAKEAAVTRTSPYPLPNTTVTKMPAGQYVKRKRDVICCYSYGAEINSLVTRSLKLRNRHASYALK